MVMVVVGGDGGPKKNRTWTRSYQQQQQREKKRKEKIRKSLNQTSSSPISVNIYGMFQNFSDVKVELNRQHNLWLMNFTFT